MIKSLTILAFLVLSLQGVAHGKDPENWNNPWGASARPDVTNAGYLQGQDSSSVAYKEYAKDLVVKKSGERIYCVIHKEDSLSLDVIITRQGKNPTHLIIKKSEINFFEYDRENERVRFHAPPPFYEEDEFAEDMSQMDYGGDPGEFESTVFTVGVLQGGGYLGVNAEFPLFGRYTIQVGIGLPGAEASLNYHFDNMITSSFMSIVARNQLLTGFGVGPSYTYRTESGLALQFGVNVYFKSLVTNEFNAEPTTMQQCILSVGYYFPISNR